MIDPPGFALEQFDAIGRWRDLDDSLRPVDASGMLPDGTKFNGVGELRRALLNPPTRFVTTLTEKLFTYALGRGLEYYDAPADPQGGSGSRRRRLPVLVADHGNRKESAVPDRIGSRP